MKNETSQKLRTPEAARFLGVSPATLTKWRCTRSDGPAFEKLGAKIVVYDIEALRDFAAKGRRRSTSEDPENSDQK